MIHVKGAGALEFCVGGEAATKVTPRYNEVQVGVMCQDDTADVYFNACRGVETDRGVRIVTLTRFYADPTTPIWRVTGERFLSMPGALTSRRGAAGDGARGNREPEPWESSLDRKLKAARS